MIISGVQHMNRAPSVTDNSEHSSSASFQPGPSLLGSDSCIRKGVMWVQQEKLFSRWKERFIILTSSYLHIFKKSTSRLSDMGTFVNKVSCKNWPTLLLVTQTLSVLLKVLINFCLKLFTSDKIEWDRESEHRGEKRIFNLGIGHSKGLQAFAQKNWGNSRLATKHWTATCKGETEAQGNAVHQRLLEQETVFRLPKF